MQTNKSGFTSGSLKSTCLSVMLFIAATVPVSSQAVLGGGLEQLVRMKQESSPNLQGALNYHITSENGEVLVDIHLQKGTSVQEVLPKLVASGFRLQAISELNPSIIEGYVALDSARDLGFPHSLNKGEFYDANK